MIVPQFLHTVTEISTITIDYLESFVELHTTYYLLIQSFKVRSLDDKEIAIVRSENLRRHQTNVRCIFKCIIILPHVFLLKYMNETRLVVLKKKTV